MSVDEDYLFNFGDSIECGRFSETELLEYLIYIKSPDYKFTISRFGGYIKIMVPGNFSPKIIAELIIGFSKHVNKILEIVN